MRKQNFKVTAAILLVAIIAGFVTAQPAIADEKTDARIEKLEAALQSLQSELAEIKADRRPRVRMVAGGNKQPQVNQSQIDHMVSKALDQRKTDLGGTPAWVQNIKLFGDLRYRHEQINDTSSSEQRDRNRIRARIGLKARINNEVDAIFRIATGSSDTPTSTNQTLGDPGNGSFSSKQTWLDWAYFDWHPESTPGLNVYGGKMKQPFYKVGKNELIWDSDVSPEGIASKYSFNIDSETTATLTGGGFWMEERSGDADTSFWGAQAMAKRNLGDGMHLLAGASYYDIGNIEDQTVAGVGLNGNTIDNGGSGGYEYDFDLIEGFGEFGFNLNDMPSAIFTNYIENTRAPTDRNTAFTVGMRLNKVTKAPGTWQLGYNYREIESDAVFAGLSGSDFLQIGGTGGKGHQFGFKYQLLENVQAGITYYVMERDNRTTPSNSDSVQLLQTDLIFKF